MQNSIIFGSSGFIGTHLQQHLQSLPEHPEIILADYTSGNANRVDVREEIQLDGNFGANTVIFNLAAIHKTPGHPDLDYFRTNISGAENVCHFATRHSIRTIVFTSSIAPYGAAEQLKSESTLPTPNTPYGISKLVAEKIHYAWMQSHPDNRLIIVRPGIVFGKGEGGNFTRLYKALAAKMFAYAGRRDTVKAAIYVKDLVRIMSEMSENKAERFQLFNCCYEPSYTIEQIVTTLQQVTGLHGKVHTIPAGILNSASSVLGVFDKFGLGFHPDRVKKLMISTNIDGKKLAAHYSLKYDLRAALEDWFADCEHQGLL